MAQLILGTVSNVICSICHTNPVATVNGRQAEQCAPCYARSVRQLAMLYSDFTLFCVADRLDTAIERATLITIEEELARR